LEVDGRAIERLRERLGRVRGLAFAAIIGSVARRGYSHHDVDVAVKARAEDKYSVLLDVLDAVSEALGVSADRVDLVDLDRADLDLKRAVLEGGVVLVDRGYLGQLAREVARRYPEYHEYRELSLREWLSSSDPSSVDAGVVKRRLDFIRSEVEFMEQYVLSRSAEEVRGSPVLRRLLERGYQLVVEAMVDVCRHVASAKGWGPAFSARDFVERCVERGVLSAEVGREVARAIALGNIIVHRYLDVDYERLYAEARGLARLAREFERQVVEFVRADLRRARGEGAAPPGSGEPRRL